MVYYTIAFVQRYTKSIVRSKFSTIIFVLKSVKDFLSFSEGFFHDLERRILNAIASLYQSDF